MKFIDLCAGIGGIRLGLEQAGMECVYSIEIDRSACLTYKENFGVNPYGDVSQLTLEEIQNLPDFDLLAAGFPCQPFSISGNKEGFMDQTRGTIFFEILNIIKLKKPTYILLENVEHLLHHQNGKTLFIIVSSLKDLGYNVSYSILNAAEFGIPQHRKRIFIVCTPLNETFIFPRPLKDTVRIKDILEKTPFTELKQEDYTLIPNPKPSKNNLCFVGYLNKKTRIKGTTSEQIHLSRNHKQPNRIYSSEYLHPTLNASETSGRYYVLHDNKVRKLSLLECFRLQGFPDSFKKVVSQTQLYRQIGNSVSVPVIKHLGIAFYHIKKNPD